MKDVLSVITLMAFFSWICACSGQEQKEDRSLKADIDSRVGKIPVPRNGFSSAYVDDDGSLWFGSNGGGIYHYAKDTFRNYTEKDGIGSDHVYSIAADDRGTLWFGDQNGLTRYSIKVFEHIPLPYQDTTRGWLATVYPILSPNAAHSLAFDDNGHLWIGTAGGGAYRYDGRYFKSYLTEVGRKQEDSLYHNWIPCIEMDNRGHLWFASMVHGGVNRFDGDVFTRFNVEDGLSDSQVRTIFCDRSGDIWMGFNGNRKSGLTVYDGILFRSYSEADGLCNRRVRAIYEDNSGNLWIGSQHGNLCIFDGQNFNEFKSDGNTFSDILFILEDLEKNIWFGGMNGIWKYDGKALMEITASG